MDPALEKIIKEVASEMNLKEDVIRQVIMTSFDGLRSEIMQARYVRCELPYFGSFSINRKAVLEFAKRKKRIELLDLVEKRDNYRTQKSYYKNELSKARSEIKDSQLG
jgi:nucleoid DNA-binding protein